MIDGWGFYPYPRPAGHGSREATTTTTVAAAGPQGISLSGGGVRSASFSLGVLQEMAQRELTRGRNRADYLSAVSGGSYIASALAFVSRGQFAVDARQATTGESTPVAPDATMPAFAPGSPEERYLRARTQYLTHGRGGRWGAIWRFLLGIACNVGLLLLLVTLIARPIGWVYGAAMRSLRSGHHCGKAATCIASTTPHHFAFSTWVTRTPLIVVAAAGVVGVLWVAYNWPREGIRVWLMFISFGLLAFAGIWFVALIGLPVALEWIRFSLPRFPHAIGIGKTPSATTSQQKADNALKVTSGAGVLLTAVTAALGVRFTQTATTVWNDVPANWRKGLAAKATELFHRVRMPLINVAAAIAGPVMVGATALWMLHEGAANVPGARGGGGGWEVVLIAVLAVVLLAVRSFADQNSWSLHPFYQERLAAAFALKRTAATPQWSPTKVGQWDAHRRPYDRGYPLSDIQSDQVPDVIICAAANISRYGAAPTGAHVSSFVFSRDDVGGPLFGSLTAKEYESGIGPELAKSVTVSAAVAASSAAFSPSMGKMTRAPFRFLLALANLRLGVWVPNPTKLDDFKSTSSSGQVRYRNRPGIKFLYREMRGRNHPDSKFLYVTDGGHYENLGLVELIRRKCRWIWCIDASGEAQDSFGTIASAIAIAFSELGVRIDIDPAGDMAPEQTVTDERQKSGKPPVVKCPYSIGRIHYPDGTLGRLVVIKAGVPANAPLDVSSYHDQHPRFPCDPTSNQLYDADRFDAYRSLGRFAMSEAFEAVAAEFAEFQSKPDWQPTG